jgi:hypothetical protein
MVPTTWVVRRFSTNLSAVPATVLCVPQAVDSLGAYSSSAPGKFIPPQRTYNSRDSKVTL